MSKKFKNECIDCEHIGHTALWKIEGHIGGAGKVEPVHIKELFTVGPEPGPNPEHFDLDTIDAKKIIKKYKITDDKAEELILSGEPCCPKCKSANYFSL